MTAFDEDAFLMEDCFDAAVLLVVAFFVAVAFFAPAAFDRALLIRKGGLYGAKTRHLRNSTALFFSDSNVSSKRI